MSRPFEGNIYLKSLLRGLYGMLICLVITGFLLMGGLSLYPKLSSSSIGDIINEMIGAFPAGLRAQFGLDMLPDFTYFGHYLAACMQVLLIIGCVYAAYLGTSALIRYESNRSIIFLCAQPVSRTAIVLSTLAAKMTLLLLYEGGVFLVCYLMGRELTVEAFLYNEGLWRLFLAFFLIQLIYLCIGLLLSAFLSHSNQAAAAAIALLLATMLFGILGSAVQGLSWMRMLSPYCYFEAYPLLQSDGVLPGLLAVICILLCVLCTILTCVRYDTKEMDI